MSSPTISPIPEGYTSVTPWIISRDTAGLLDFVSQAFDGIELARVVGEDGTIGHAEFRIGNAIVMGFDAKPDWPIRPPFCASTSRTPTRRSGAPSPRAPRR